MDSSVLKTKSGVRQAPAVEKMEPGNCKFYKEVKDSKQKLTRLSTKDVPGHRGCPRLNYLGMEGVTPQLPGHGGRPRLNYSFTSMIQTQNLRNTVRHSENVTQNRGSCADNREQKALFKY